MQRFAVEFRAEVAGDTLRGHAAVFGQTARVAGGYEQIAPTAFNEALKASDVRALLNHNPTLVLGRQSAGTLRLHVDDQGLAFEVDLPDTSYARDLRELVARGDVTGASFGFVPGQDEYRKAPDGKQVRTHTSVAQLLDVSPVTWPAYDGTNVALRHMDWGVQQPTLRQQLIIARHRALHAREG